MNVERFKMLTPSVAQALEDPVLVSSQDISDLIVMASHAETGRARILLHPDSADSLHEMVIALPADSCDHPHINFKSSKSFLALSGTFAVVTFSNDGEEVKLSILSADERNEGRIARLNAPAWHTIIPLVGNVVFLETIIGPFEGNQFASWFPDRTKQPSEYRVAADQLRQIAKMRYGE